MKTLEKHNSALEKMYRVGLNSGPIKNGISCPKCGSELFDSRPNVTLTSVPPKKSVSCGCGYHGFRVA